MIVNRREYRIASSRGAAALELALMMPLLLGLIIGVWELGRFVQLQQIMNNAARTGARVAAQSRIVNATGTYTQIAVTSSNPNVHDTVAQYLQGAGISDLTGLQVTFVYLNHETSKTEPYQGDKNQQFRVRVTLPYANLRWTDLSLINPTTLGGECVWQIMVDDPFTVSTTLPGWMPSN